ncbi:beta-1,6-N-acetylglucosaminyltransferase [Xylanibacter rarus]|uniref:Peptide O-xylosyltransferase n=1 Tax=Xylanibacter rarus TaxID=1676614 RepID=A0A8E1QVL1_9BACT|nr:beta-1,6-N-acetylglucosaminyltransferase [Xylanibacter rarus]KOO65771.1 hypothetical protein ACU52_14420 [Xylanibacter rarus]
MIRNRHAYLIIAHDQPELLQILISLIDDVRNDIFITIDSRTDINIFKSIKAQNSNLFFTQQNNNCWGSVKLVETEFLLFETARKKEHYSYYHLLSGQDLPIKSQDYIHQVCDKLQGKEFVEFEKESPQSLKVLNNKTRYFYILQNHFRCNNIFEKIIVRLIQKSFLSLQNVFQVRRRYKLELKKGCQWVSITDNFCKYLIEHKEEILQMFNHTFCPDEIFLQTVLWNSPYKNNIYDYEDEYHSCLRYIDWKRGEPYIWKENDFDELINSTNKCFFARKFNVQDKNLINKIVMFLNKNE